MQLPRENVWFDSLQALRAVAAVMVIVEHITHEIHVILLKKGAPSPSWTTEDLPFGTGVDIFFVISGFIMVMTSRNLIGKKDGWQTFLRKRFIRIVPLYWFYTSLMISVLLILPSAFDTAQADVGHFIKSYLFIPHERPAGGIRPLLSLGWTLNYEMFFYGIFAGLLFLPIRFFGWVVAGVLVMLSLLHAYVPYEWSALYFWTTPIILEFAAGMGIAYLWLARVRLPGWTLLPILALCVWIFFGLHYYPDIGPEISKRTPSFIIAILSVAALTLVKGVPGRPLPNVVREMGDASYTLYLSHPFFIGATAIVANKADLSPEVHMGTSLLLCLAGGYVAYRIFEKPALEYFRGK